MNLVEGVNYSLVAFSILISVITAYTVLNMVAHVSRVKRKLRLYWLLIISFITSIWIWFMHFIYSVNRSLSVNDNYEDRLLKINFIHLAVAIGIGTIVILVHSKFAALLNQKKFTQTKQLKTMEQYYQSLFDQNPDLILTFDLDGRFLRANRVVELYGYREEELLNRSFSPFVHPDHLEQTMKHFLTAAHGQATNYDTTVFQKDGLLAEMNVTNIPIFVDGKIVGVYGILKDITQRKKTEQALIEAESKYRSLVEESLVGVYIIQDHVIVYANPRVSEMFGYEQGDFIGMEPSILIHPDDWPMVSENIQKRLRNEVSSMQYQCRGIRKDQGLIYAEVLGSRTIYGGREAIIGTIIDITERKKSEERISHMAYHDRLTGLPKRHRFMQHLKMELEDAKPNGRRFAVLCIGLDRFKVINDTLGHDLGDALIQKAAERLKNDLHTGDFLSRRGGDEFLLLLNNSGEKEAVVRAEQILDELARPFLLEQYEIYMTASIGISLYPISCDHTEMLIKHADTAMRMAKGKGMSNYQIYTSDMNQNSQERMQMETDLRKALDKGEFIVHYQPQVHLRTGKVIGVEALVRWQHPERGFISPATFIPLAEETGLIIPIGEWILRTACLQNKHWQELGLPPLVISVNLSPRQFLNSDIVNTVARILNETELQANYLELEITEGMTVDVNRTITVLQELKKLGVKISLDDFGTGYSSLHYLKKFPIDTLKIDQSFVRDCTTDLNDAAIVKTIIAMAHSMKLHVIAEGVETEEQLSFLHHHLCDEVQGYLFSKPLSSNDFEREYIEIERKAKKHGISLDISHRLHLEEELRRDRQDLEETVRKQQGMTLKYTKQSGCYIHTLCDGELLYRMGFTPEQVVGKALADFLPTDVAAVKTAFYERAWQGEQHVVYEGMLNGIVYMATLRPVIRGGNVVEVIASCVDITERKKAEEALRESEAQYRLIAENMTDLVGVLDRNGVVLYASPSHLDVLGLSPEMLQGTLAFDMVHPEDIPHVQKQFAKVVSLGRPEKAEFRYMHHDGYFLYVEANGSPVFDENGQLQHIVTVSRDITERKKTEELLRKTEGLFALGELAAGVAHEIRNPLTTIKGFVQLLDEGVYKPTYTPIVLDELSRIESIIQEFLMLGKQQVIPNGLVHIGELVQQVTGLLETQTILKTIIMHLEIEADLPMITGKVTKLKQVFVNLLRNAIDAMGDKGGEIRFQAQRQENGCVLIRIIDQGCGMDEEQIKRLGEPFYSNKTKGTGLGLMVCYQIIQEHHGSIRFQSELHQGTTVEVTLPIILD